MGLKDLPTLADQPAKACPKPATGTRKRLKNRTKRQQSKRVKSIRTQVFDRDQGICRCCGIRVADSMHEIVPRSLGGKVSLTNSIAVCGSGTTKCHGMPQGHRIWVHGRDANGPLRFEPATQAAKDWMAGR